MVICGACGVPGADTNRFCPACGTPLGGKQAPAETRKNVTVLFVDIVGSTALAERLDPEPLRQVMDRYFAGCQSAVAEHGGMVEKYIGDAVLAVFGAVVAHEDDAVRAVRAAAASLAALRGLNADISVSHRVSLEARCGICSGEAMVITAADGNFRVVGDAVNTASRLQTAAAPGEILVGEETAAMLRGDVGLAPVAPLRLKGKSRHVPAWRVTDPEGAAGAPRVRDAAPLIGRDDEMAELGHRYRRVSARRQVCLVTVLGSPGIGKSRLVREFAAGLARNGATVMTGRCFAYGAGMTYAPLAEMLRSLPGGWERIASLLAGQWDAGPGSHPAGGLAAILGMDQEPAAAGPGPSRAGIEEIAWALRRLLAALGKAGPVVTVWEDLHWAEETLLDLIDEVATWLTDVPVLLLCVARSELLEARPSWGGGKPCAMTLELGPLSPPDCAALVGELLLRADAHGHDEAGGHGQIAAQCEGNPLFAELMVDVCAGSGGAAGQIPPTINAVLTARLDQLPPGERRLAEMAAAWGREVPLAALRAMAGPEGFSAREVASHVSNLVRRGVLQRTGPDACRFTQALLHEAAYSLVPKARRESWHLFLAQWLADQEAAPGQRNGPDDTLAFARHVEAARALRQELMPGDRSLPPLASQAADALAAEGMKALARKDLPAAAALLDRARDLLAPDDPRHAPLALHICDSWIGSLDVDRALAAVSAAHPASGRDRRTRLVCQTQRCIVNVRFGLVAPDAADGELRRIAAELETGAGDDLNWCRYHQARAYHQLARERAAMADSSLRLALARARAMGDDYEEERLLCAICEVSQWSPVPAADGLELCDALARRFASNRAMLVPVLVTQAYLSALAGQVDGARGMLATARGHVSDLHLDRADAAVVEMSGVVESLAGAHRSAEQHYRRAAAALGAAPGAPDARLLETAIARSLFEQGKTAQAAALLEELGEGPDPALRSRIAITALRGRLAAARGERQEAARLAGEAAGLSAETDDPCLAAAALFDLAVVLSAAGRAEESAVAGAGALERLSAKGASLPASRVRAWLARQGLAARGAAGRAAPAPTRS